MNSADWIANMREIAVRLRARAAAGRQDAGYSDDPRTVREDHAYADGLMADAAALVRAVGILAREHGGVAEAVGWAEGRSPTEAPAGGALGLLPSAQPTTAPARAGAAAALAGGSEGSHE